MTLEKWQEKSDREIFLWAAIVPGGVLAFVWLLWILSQFWGIDLINIIKRRRNERDVIQPTFYLYFAIAATLIATIWTWLSYRKKLRLIRHGVILDAQLTKIGIGTSGMRSCNYRFNYKGTEYNQNLSLLESTANEIGVGGTLQIVLDPDNPKRNTPTSEL